MTTVKCAAKHIDIKLDVVKEKVQNLFEKLSNV
jgi:hypothetical protein